MAQRDDIWNVHLESDVTLVDDDILSLFLSSSGDSRPHVPQSPFYPGENEVTSRGLDLYPPDESTLSSSFPSSSPLPSSSPQQPGHELQNHPAQSAGLYGHAPQPGNQLPEGQQKSPLQAPQQMAPSEFHSSPVSFPRNASFHFNSSSSSSAASSPQVIEISPQQFAANIPRSLSANNVSSLAQYYEQQQQQQMYNRMQVNVVEKPVYGGPFTLKQEVNKGGFGQQYRKISTATVPSSPSGSAPSSSVPGTPNPTSTPLPQLHNNHHQHQNQNHNNNIAFSAPNPQMHVPPPVGGPSLKSSAPLIAPKPQQSHTNTHPHTPSPAPAMYPQPVMPYFLAPADMSGKFPTGAMPFGGRPSFAPYSMPSFIGPPHRPERENDKRTKRLARNRESARQSRKRKKMYLELLEDKVAKLTTEVADLRRQLTGEKEVEVKLDMDKHALFGKLESMLKLASSEDEIGGIIDELRVRLGANGSERRGAMDYYFNQLEELLLPAYIKYLLWTGEENTHIFGGENEGPKTAQAASDAGLVKTEEAVPRLGDGWQALINAMGLTEEQTARIRRYRSALVAEKQKLGTCVQNIEQLRGDLALRAYVMQQHIDQLRSFLSPSQTAKFLIWVNHNSTLSQPLSTHHLWKDIKVFNGYSRDIHMDDEGLDQDMEDGDSDDDSQ